MTTEEIDNSLENSCKFNSTKNSHSSSLSRAAPAKRRPLISDAEDDDEEEDNRPLFSVSRRSSRSLTSPPITYYKGNDSESDSDDDVPLVKLVKKSKLNLSQNSSLASSRKFSPAVKKSRQEIITETKVSAKTRISEERKTSNVFSAETKSIRKSVASNVTTFIKREKNPLKKAVEEPVKIKKEFNTPMNVKAELSALKRIKAEPGKDSGTEGEADNWWDSQEAYQEDDSIKWTTLEHAGVYFPLDYIPHGVPMKYDGQKLKLPAAVEEAATFFAAVVGTPYAENPTFCANFFADFRELVLQGTPLFSVITDFKKCDFMPITEHLIAQKELRKSRSKEEKEAEKKEKQEILDKYGFCLLDGKKEKVGNFRVEPPGLFRGRGDHPKTGCMKLRVQPEQITLNLSANAPVPIPLEGHSWGKIVHDQHVTWLASWTENIQGDTKYVFLAAGSKWKGQSDLKKFEKARELAKIVEEIRRVNAKELKDPNLTIKQRATALWLIDRLALRAGNEKGEDEADTVGCCSLRIEHVSLESPDTVIFDFLGKDSIRYYNQVQVPDVILSNLRLFMGSPKKPGELIFDTLTTSSLNSYLNGLMPGLTAKVFRTFNASFTFEVELQNTPVNGTTAEKILAYNRANRQVAVLCNHQRSVSKTHVQSMEKLEDKIDVLKHERQLVRAQLKKKLSSSDIKTRTDDLMTDYESDMDSGKMKKKEKDYIESIVEKQKKLREKKFTLGTVDSAELGELKMPVPLSEQVKEWEVDKLEKKFSMLYEKIRTLKLQRIDRDENKQTALGTSKTNYIDPRISMAWYKQHQVPIEKIFNRSLQEKFQWASVVDETWRFYDPKSM